MKRRITSLEISNSEGEPSHGVNAFTLIELLVAIAVLAVLIGLIFTSISKVREASLSTKCVGNVRSMMVAFHAWYNDVNRQLPRMGEPESKINYTTYFLPYLGGKELRCPLASTPSEKSASLGFRYAINDSLRRYPSSRPINEYAHRTVLAAEMYSMGEGFWSSTHLNNTINGSSGRRPQVHSGGLNLGFWDGSVRNIQPVLNEGTGKGDWTLTPIYGTKAEGYFYNSTQFSNFMSGRW